jgi:hypothetical protein
MRLRSLATAVAAVALVAGSAAPAMADSAKPGQSMTHIKTAPGISAALEGAGVVLYSQGGATSAVMGDSIAAANGQVVFHVPITSTKAGVQHVGSTLVFFNTANNREVQLRNPVVDVAKGIVTASVPQGTNQPITVLTISNAAALKAVVKTDRKTRVRTTTYTGAQLAIAPGVGPVIESLLGLPAGAVADGTVFASADVTLSSVVRRR